MPSRSVAGPTPLLAKRPGAAQQAARSCLPLLPACPTSQPPPTTSRPSSRRPKQAQPTASAPNKTGALSTPEAGRSAAQAPRAASGARGPHTAHATCRTQSPSPRDPQESFWDSPAAHRWLSSPRAGRSSSSSEASSSLPQSRAGGLEGSLGLTPCGAGWLCFALCGGREVLPQGRCGRHLPPVRSAVGAGVERCYPRAFVAAPRHAFQVCAN